MQTHPSALPLAAQLLHVVAWPFLFTLLEAVRPDTDWVGLTMRRR